MCSIKERNKTRRSKTRLNHVWNKIHVALVHLVGAFTRIVSYKNTSYSYIALSRVDTLTFHSLPFLYTFFPTFCTDTQRGFFLHYSLQQFVPTARGCCTKPVPEHYMPSYNFCFDGRCDYSICLLFLLCAASIHIKILINFIINSL